MSSKRKRYKDVDEAIARITRNGGKVNKKNKTVSFSGTSKPGIKILGAIDFLTGSNGYRRTGGEQ